MQWIGFITFQMSVWQRDFMVQAHCHYSMRIHLFSSNSVFFPCRNTKNENPNEDPKMKPEKIIKSASLWFIHSFILSAIIHFHYTKNSGQDVFKKFHLNFFPQ